MRCVNSFFGDTAVTLVYGDRFYLFLFQVSLLPILVTSDSELDVGESVIHSLPPVHFPEPTPPYAPHASHPGPYTPTPYPPYGYPAPPHQHALLPESPVFRNPFESHDLGDALRTADGDHLVSADLYLFGQKSTQKLFKKSFKAILASCQYVLKANITLGKT